MAKSLEQGWGISPSGTWQDLSAIGEFDEFINHNQGDHVVSLDQLRVGDMGYITHIDQNNVFAERLSDLGFVRGSVVKVIQQAPLHDPIEYEVRGSRFCLRQSEARDIYVIPLRVL
jgi:Fe2+ transport system protein FeoA